MAPLEAPPPKGEKTQEEDEKMDEEEQPPSATPKEQETDPVSPEIDPMDYKEDEGQCRLQQRGQIHLIQDHSQPKKMSHLHHHGNRPTTAS